MEKLNYKYLKPVLYVKNYIKYYDDRKIYEDNYEKYLLEFINKSSLGKYGIFKYNNNQNNGETDIISDNYTLDFKLLLDNKFVEMAKLYSREIYVLSKSCHMTSYNKEIIKKYYNNKNTAISLYGVFSKYTYGQLQNIESIEDIQIRYAIKRYLKNIKIEKNVLYYLPISIEGISNNISLKYIVKKVSLDLESFLEYRKNYVSDKDTYICFFSKNQLILCEVNGIQLKVIDTLDEDVSQIYMNLKKI